MKIWFTSLALMAISSLFAQQKEGTVLYEKKTEYAQDLTQ
jgi:hypothetical protein